MSEIRPRTGSKALLYHRLHPEYATDRTQSRSARRPPHNEALKARAGCCVPTNCANVITIQVSCYNPPAMQPSDQKHGKHQAEASSLKCAPGAHARVREDPARRQAVSPWYPCSDSNENKDMSKAVNSPQCILRTASPARVRHTQPSSE